MNTLISMNNINMDNMEIDLHMGTHQANRFNNKEVAARDYERRWEGTMFPQDQKREYAHAQTKVLWTGLENELTRNGLVCVQGNVLLQRHYGGTWDMPVTTHFFHRGMYGGVPLNYHVGTCFLDN